ncbi:hypothetical protein MASR1M31_11290 [Porphyromonadaceae bacterium]
MEILENLYEMTALSNIIAEPQFLIMYAIAFVLLYRGSKAIRATAARANCLYARLPISKAGGMGIIQALETGDIVINGVTKNIWLMPLHDTSTNWES